MRLNDADELREYWLYSGLNENIYDTNDVLESIDEQPTVDPESLRPSDRIRHLADILENEHRDRFITIDTFAYTLRRLADIVAKDEPAH